MELILDFCCLCMLCNEVLNILKLPLISTFKPRRIMKQEFRIAFEGKRTIDVMNTTLDKVRNGQHDTLCAKKKSMPLLLAPTNCKDVRIRTEASRLTGNIPNFYFLHRRYKAPRLCCRLASRELFCQRWHGRSQECEIDGISFGFQCCRSC